MTEPQFEEFLSKSIKNFGDEYIELDEDLYEPHEFSPEFERKMEKLFRPKKHIRFPLFRTRRRRIASVVTAVVVLSSAAAMSVGAVKSRLFGFKMKKAPTHTVVSFENDGTSSEGFDKVYEITELPEGFELVDRSQDFDKIATEYRNNDKYIKFEQWEKKYYNVNDDTEYKNIEDTIVNGYEGYILNEKSEGIIVTWASEKYVFKIYSNIDMSELYHVISLIE